LPYIFESKGEVNTSTITDRAELEFGILVAEGLVKDKASQVKEAEETLVKT